MAVLESESESDDIPLARQIPKAAAAAAAAPAPAVKREKDTVVNQTKAKGTKKVKTTSKPVGAKKKVKEEENGNDGKAAKRPKYEMPGQTRPTPDSTDPLVKFYSSLHEQSKGGSAMAAKWLMQHGMLPLAEATKLANSIAMAKKRSAVKVEGTRAKGTAKAKASAPKRRKKS